MGYFRAEAYGGESIPLNEMHSKIGKDQVDFECEMCGHLKSELLEPCGECGEPAGQANKYAQMITDLKIKLGIEGFFTLPGILAFDNSSDAQEYASRVSGATICEYEGTELYHGMQEPDFGADEFLIIPKTREVKL